MATTLTSSIINVNIAILKRTLESLGDIKVLSIKPKNGIVLTTVILVRGDGISNLTGPQQSSAQAVIDAHVDGQQENLRLIGNSESRFGTRLSNGEIIFEQGTDVWKFDSTHNLLPVSNANRNIGSTGLRINNLYGVHVDLSGNLFVTGNLTVMGSSNISGGSITLVENEVPGGLINGINTVYTLANNCVSASVKLYYNGVRLAPGASRDYTVTGAAQITMNFAPASPDVLLVDYTQA